MTVDSCDHPRHQVYATIAGAIERGDLLPDDPAATPEQLSVVAAITPGGDLAALDADSGMPACLTLMLDMVVKAMANDRAAARSFVLRWFGATPAVEPIVPAARTAAWFLSDLPDDGSISLAIRTAAASVRAMHEDRASGRIASRRDWSDARSDALAATDAATGSLERQFGELVEALAWPVDRSRTVLADALRCYSAMRAIQAAERLGWGDDQRRESDATMHRIWEDTAAERERDPQSYEFHPHFARAHPELAAGFIAALEAQNLAYADAACRVGDAALGFIEGSGAATADALVATVAR